MALQQIANTDISSTGTFALGSVSSSTLTSGRVTYATTGGLLTDSSSLTYDGTTLTSTKFAGALNGTVGATTPSTVVATSVTNSGLTSGRITYASTGGLLVDSANLTFSGTNVGIGTASPAAKLDLGGNTASTVQQIFGRGVTDTDFTVRYTNGAAGTSAFIGTLGLDYANGTFADMATIKFYRNSVAGELAFFASASGVSGTEKLRITSTTLHTANGVSVGIGTDSPYGLLNIKGSNGQLVLANGNTSGGMKLTASNSIYTGNGYLAFEGYANEYGRFDSSGNFMVGATSSSAIANRNIDVNGTGDASFNLRVGGTTCAYFYTTAGQTLLGTVGALPITFYPNGVERMRIATDGTVTIGNAVAATNVNLVLNGVVSKAQRIYFSNSGVEKWLIGAGAASETSAFEIYNTSGTIVLSIDKTNSVSSFGAPVNVYGNMIVTRNAIIGINGDNVAAGTFAFRDVSGVQKAAIASYYNVADEGALEFMNGTTTKMIMRSGGNVGIGTTSPAAFTGFTTNRTVLQIANTTSDSGQIILGGATNALLLDYNNAAGDVTIRNTYGASAAGALINIDSGTLVFRTGTSYTQAMRITSGGNVVIGSTTTPDALLHVYQASGKVATFGNNVNDNGNYIVLGGTVYNKNWVISNNMLVGGEFGIGRTSAAGGTTIGSAHDLMINSSGNVLIGTTTIVDTYSALLVLQAAYPKTRMEIRNDGETSALYAITFRNGNGLIGNITTTGSTTAFNTSSDYRLKRDVQPMTGALAKVIALKPVTYKWKADGSDGQGFIAHELAEVCADAVTGVKDEVNDDGSIKPQGIDSSFLVATLTAAIQEQQALIESMATKLKDAGVAGF